jgi:hypothetical protein
MTSVAWLLASQRLANERHRPRPGLAELMGISRIYDVRGGSQPRSENQYMSSDSFTPMHKQGRLNNDKHHGKTDLEMVEQERQYSFSQYTNQQRWRNSYQTNLAAT